MQYEKHDAVCFTGKHWGKGESKQNRYFLEAVSLFFALGPIIQFSPLGFLKLSIVDV